MNWVLDHLQILVAAAAAIAFWLNQRREARKANEAGPSPDEATAAPFPPAAPEPRPVLSPDELRRRILEQLGIPTDEPPAPASEPVVVPSLPPPLPQPELRPVIARSVEPVEPAAIKPAITVRSAAIRRAFSSPAGLREAMILREVLGPPIALRAGRPQSVGD